jgi:ArsR family transcriptional regulator
MKDYEKVLKALANRRRLAIVKHLKDKGETSVGDIAEAIRLSFRSTSRHLGVLASADIVEKEQRSLQMFYRLQEPQHPAAKSIIKLV